MTLVDQLVAVAKAHASDSFDDKVAVAELRCLAGSDHQALEQAIPACLAQPASLAARRRENRVPGRGIRYEDPPAPES